MSQKTVAIIGGGASGLIAAVSAARILKGNAQVLLIERANRIGKKILQTGNGKCNLTNLHTDHSSYAASYTKVPLARFGVSETLDFFEELGLHCKSDQEGRVYPYSESAASVLDVLRIQCANLKVQEICGFNVKEISLQQGRFLVGTAGRALTADALIFACGGKASPSSASMEGAYHLIYKFGHFCTELYPSLAPVQTDASSIRGLNGIRAKVTLRLLQGANIRAEESGELLFKEGALSGIVVFQISSTIARLYKNSAVSAPLSFSIDFLPGLSEIQVLPFLVQRRKNLSRMRCGQFLTGLLHKQLSQRILDSSGIHPEHPVSALSDFQLKQLALRLKAFSLPVLSTAAWRQAQVTCGGFYTDQFTPEFESVFCPGLFVCGEALDVDGACGGFNLQWAWTSGYLAGKAAAKRITGQISTELRGYAE